jgi:RNA polymerase sigma-70 factor (ECF subfamily)
MQAEGKLVDGPDAGTATGDFGAFYEEEHRRLFKALYFVCGNRADAADLMHDAFARLWERWDRVERMDDPTGYLFRTAMNVWRMRRRAARRAAARIVMLAPAPDPYGEIELREDVRAMLRSLAPRQRAALVLLDIYGYGSEDAARIMGIRPSTVRALATQGRAVLRAREATDD